MSLVPAICTQCGAKLKINGDVKAATCPYCGAEFVVEQAISNYSLTVNNEIKADVVNILGADDKNERDKALFYLEATNFEKALLHVDKAIEINPRCGETWSIKARVEIKLGNFTEAEKAFDLMLKVGGQASQGLADVVLAELETADPYVYTFAFLEKVVIASSKDFPNWARKEFEAGRLSFKYLKKLSPDLDAATAKEAVAAAFEAAVKNKDYRWFQANADEALKSIEGALLSNGLAAIGGKLYLWSWEKYNDGSETATACVLMPEKTSFIFCLSQSYDWRSATTAYVAFADTSRAEHSFALNATADSIKFRIYYNDLIEAVRFLEKCNAKISFTHMNRNHIKTINLSEKRGWKEFCKLEKKRNKAASRVK